jgi:AraC-like DNA-binding protein
LSRSGSRPSCYDANSENLIAHTETLFMRNVNYFSRRLLFAAAKVKDAIDLKFKLVTDVHQQPAIKDTIGWKNAETFAAEIKVKRDDLQKCFVSEYGKKISEYQMEMKIKAACILLADSEMTIKEIAVELGYHQDYFSYIFKKQTGMAPTEWKKREWERNFPKIQENGAKI